MLNKILTSSKSVTQTAYYRLRNNINVTEEICFAAVKQYGNALGYVPGHLRTEQLCLEAVKQNGYAIRWVPEQLITEAICLIAVKQNKDALYWVPEQLRNKIKSALKHK